MKARRTVVGVSLVVGLHCLIALSAAQTVPVDFSQYSPSSGVQVRRDGNRLTVGWQMDGGEFGRLTFDLTPGEPLIESMGIGAETLLQNVEPVTWLTVGTRNAPPGRPPQMSIWNVFFDKPASRPHQTFASRLDLKCVRVSSAGKRATIALGDLTIGSFSGEWQFTFYSGSRLVHAEAVVSTQEDRRAIIYDAGLIGGVAEGLAKGLAIAWMNTEGQVQRVPYDSQTPDRPLAVRHRAIIAESDKGSVACFPPPHQYQFPRDLTDNFKFVWMGRGHVAHASSGRDARATSFGFGVRQDPAGGGAFVPWFNAPPHTQQRLGVFYLLSRGRAEDALRETLRYTHGDKFVALPGHITFTSHYHTAVGVNAMEGKQRMNDEYARVFKAMGVNAVHLADFHGDGHQKDPGPLRLPELESLFAECRRLSDDQLLMIPGEEVNEYLGIAEPGKHPGHWMSLFPRPVYWTQRRAPDQPFVEQHPKYGTVYRVGSRQDMMELLKRENGLAWTAHPRIKASSWTPDIFRNEDFYLADFWLGGAWKAMPADLSRERLGERALDVLSDMANWGQKKYLLGEVDTFKVDHTHELYGHSNVNYLRVRYMPGFDNQVHWWIILDALQRGKFFVTTGEVLIREFTVGGEESGESLVIPTDGKPTVRVTLDWTFPLKFAEVISGDGKRVYRERIDLTDTTPFGRRTLTLKPNLRGRKWVRFEVWDVAVNGAFTQPVWLITEDMRGFLKGKEQLTYEDGKHLKALLLKGGTTAAKELEKWYASFEQKGRKRDKPLSIRVSPAENRMIGGKPPYTPVATATAPDGRVWGCFCQAAKDAFPKWYHPLWLGVSRDGVDWKTHIFSGLSHVPVEDPTLSIKDNQLIITYMSGEASDYHFLEKPKVSRTKRTFSLAAFERDSDKDGVPDFDETVIGTDPKKSDSDGDGVSDGLDNNPTVPYRTQLSDQQKIIRAIFYSEGIRLWIRNEGRKSILLSTQSGAQVELYPGKDIGIFHVVDKFKQQPSSTPIRQWLSEGRMPPGEHWMSFYVRFTNRQHTQAEVALEDIEYGIPGGAGFKAEKVKGQWIITELLSAWAP